MNLPPITRFITKPAFCLLFLGVLYGNLTVAQIAGPRSHYQPVTTGNYVMSKNYYLLTLFQALPDVKQLIGKDPVLKAIAKTKSDSLQFALKNCMRDGFCYLSKLTFSEEEIKTVSARLTALYKPGNPLDKLVKQHLLPSGCYILFQHLSPVEMLVKAWEQDANGINFCIGVYAEGKKPNYPLIDSIGFRTRDPRSNQYLPGYVSLLYNTSYLLSFQANENAAFFFIPLTASLRFLEMNERNQAADFEPMAAGENRKAVAKIKQTDWSKYKYSVILVPGAGPDEPNVAFSAEGMIRCRLAAIQYHKGLAPFIVVSGGKVHPYKTKFCEAIEMKKFLVETLHIPESAIIIDPHARHTTTNMRNTVRMMFRYGMPINKAGITCTTRGQSNMISNTLIARCRKELNLAPYKNGLRLSETEMEFYPLIEALHINPMEPMDP
jgi:hypothetical protein